MNVQRAINQTPRSDLVIRGDWKARPGPPDNATRQVLGTFLVDQMATIASTRFDCPKRHLLTWCSSDGHNKSQIDQLDCRVHRGAETCIAHGSEQCKRVVLRIRLPRANRPKSFDISRLQMVAGAFFLVALQNCFNGLQQTDSQDPEHGWQSLKSTLTGIANTRLRKSRRRNRDWVMRNSQNLFV